MPVATRTFVHEHRSLEIDPQNRATYTIACAQTQPLDSRKQWRLDGVIADLMDVTLGHVESIIRKPNDLSRLVMYSQNKDATMRIGSSGEPVSEVVPIG